MMRMLRWTLLLVVGVALVGGCAGGGKDQIPTKISDKPLGPPQLPGGGGAGNKNQAAQ
jgi:hypothetical protein